MADFHLPGDRQRCTIIGKTGSGKTQAALWQLSQRSFHARPWVMFDFKLDPMLQDIAHTDELRITDAAPKKPGLYIVHPPPGADHAEELDAFLWRLWAKGNTGIYIDEGYMLSPRSDAFQAILTQGRSKGLPVIMLTQRPTWVTRFAFSEADYIQLFQLTDTRDKKVVREFMPMPIETDLPAPYYSWWWDNTRNYKAILKPAPSRDAVLDAFYARTKQRRKVL